MDEEKTFKDLIAKILKQGFSLGLWFGIGLTLFVTGVIQILDMFVKAPSFLTETYPTVSQNL